MRTTPVLVAVLVLPSCSLLGLDDFEIPVCATDTDCDPLNRRDGLADACQRWQCNPAAAENAHCTLRALDLDDDGSGPPECPIGTEVDCDDQNEHRSPDALEVCNGVDDDCDVIVDEDLQDPAPGEMAPVDVDRSFDAPDVGFLGAAGQRLIWIAAGGGDPQVIGPDGTPGELPWTVEQPPAAPVSGCVRRVRTPMGPAPAEPIETMPFPVGCCRSNAECDDGVICNGLEVCRPFTDMNCPARLGCSATVVDACSPGDECDAAAEACVARMEESPCGVVSLAASGDPPGLAVAIGSTCLDGTVRVALLTEGGGLAEGSAALCDPDLILGVDADSTQCTGRSRAAGGPVGARAPAIAAAVVGSRRIGVGAWLAAPLGEPPRCGVSVPVEAIAVFERFRRLEADYLGADVPAQPPLQLGDAASALGGPAVVAVPGTPAVFVIAWAEADAMALQVARVTAPPTGDDACAVPTSLDLGARARLTLEGAIPGEVSLVVGDAAGPEVSLGMAWRQGCDATSTIHFGSVRLDLDTGTTSAWSPIEVSVAPGGRAPAITWTAHDLAGSGGGTWLVAFVQGPGIGLRRIPVTGAATDEPDSIAPGIPATRVVWLEPGADGALALGYDNPMADHVNRRIVACSP